jgi:hypothetical protein
MNVAKTLESKFHFTPAITYVLHSVFSIIIGALVGGLIYFGQYAFTGSADTRAVFLSALSGALLYFSTHIGALANSPQAAQAESDGLGQVKASVEDLIASHNNLLNFLTQAPTPAPSVSAPTPQAVPQPAPQFVQVAPAPFSFQATQTFPTLPVVPAQIQQ